MNRIRFLLVLFLALGVSACSARIRHSRPTGEKLSRSESLELFNQLWQAGQEVKGYKALGKTVVKRGGHKEIGRQAILSRFPSDLRIELLPVGVGYSTSMLLADPSGAYLIDFLGKETIYTRQPQKLIARLFGVSLTASDLAALLACRIPRRVVGIALDDRAEVRKAQQFFSSLFGSDRFFLSFDRLDGSYRRFETISPFNNSEFIVFQCEKDDSRIKKITIESDSHGFYQKIIYSIFELNPEFKAGIFNLPESISSHSFTEY